MPKSIHRNSAFASLVLITGLFATSCVKSVDPKVLQLRNELTAKVEPKDSISLTDAKTVLAEEADVVLLGRVGSGDLDPFEKGKAMFVLSEAPEDHGEGMTPANVRSANAKQTKRHLLRLNSRIHPARPSHMEQMNFSVCERDKLSLFRDVVDTKKIPTHF